MKEFTNLNTRNFAIIAHIDHGKSTLADRLLEHTHTLDKKVMRAQVLDSMDLERERGITIKAHPIRLSYNARDGQMYQLNLIDTPGHVDFTYEVSRSLFAVEGVILVVDGTQGVEAQTMAHTFLAKSLGKIIIPIINKIDLPAVNIDSVLTQLKEIFDIEEDEVILVSAKEGIGIEELLEAVIKRIPPPIGDINMPLSALIFDGWFDSYKGVVVYVRVFDGLMKEGLPIEFMATKIKDTVSEVGTFKLGLVPQTELSAGEVGYFTAGIKNLSQVKIGDTITTALWPIKKPLPGYKELKPMVFCGLYPGSGSDYSSLATAIERLRLNDSSWVVTSETSSALGMGFRCGFLGLLHMEIIQERLEREYNLDIIATLPHVPYQIIKPDGEIIVIENPTNFPASSQSVSYEEPYIEATMLTPAEFVGNLIKLAQQRRGVQKRLEYLEGDRMLIVYILPLAEVIIDFYDKLKSISRGYASFDYEHIGYRPTKLVKVDVLISQEEVDALSFICYYNSAYQRARDLTLKLKEVIPRQQFMITIQATIGSRIIAKETISAYRKDVTAKCYGGDITRKRKLWEKQKDGKKRMKKIGKIILPQEAFRALLEIG